MELNHNIDEELRVLRENVDRSHRLERELESMLARQSAIDERLELLKKIKYDEQRDVDRIEGNHLARLWYYITGKTDEKLSKEKEEALAAAAKYETVKAESIALTDSIFRTREELARLGSCDRRYAEKLSEKHELVRLTIKNSAHNDEIAVLSEKISRLDESVNKSKRTLKELDEAISSGEAAKSTAARILEKLGKADSYASWDVLGGGLIADMAKHEQLDEAQALIEALQCELGRFTTELTDVDISSDMRIDIDASLKFADFFFDGLIADLMVADRIRKATESVSVTRSKVAGILNRLEKMRVPVSYDYERDKAELERLINEIKL